MAENGCHEVNLKTSIQTVSIRSSKDAHCLCDLRFVASDAVCLAALQPMVTRGAAAVQSRAAVDLASDFAG